MAVDGNTIARQKLENKNKNHSQKSITNMAIFKHMQHHNEQQKSMFYTHTQTKISTALLNIGFGWGVGLVLFFGNQNLTLAQSAQQTTQTRINPSTYAYAPANTKLTQDPVAPAVEDMKNRVMSSSTVGQAELKKHHRKKHHKNRGHKKHNLNTTTTNETNPVFDSTKAVDLAKKIDQAKSNAASTMFAGQDLVMYSGEVIVLNVGKVDRVALGNGKLASASVLDENRLLIIAQDVGDTNILLWNKAVPMKEIRLRVTAQNMDRVKREASMLLSEVPNLKIGNVGDKIFIEGYDLTEMQLGRVKALAAQYPSIIDRTMGKARPPQPAEPSTMILFDLYFVEFKKSFLQNVGVNWQKTFNGFNFGIYGEALNGNQAVRAGSGASGVTLSPNLGRSAGVSTSFQVGASLPATINMAVDSGDAVLLAAPKIASRSGGKAKFTAGGEVPLPSTSLLGGSNVNFKSYGILLEVEPQINADGSVSGTVRTEVSAIDPAVTVREIPGFLTRRTEADFYSKEGQAVVLSGLYSQESGVDNQKVPLLGDLPLIGSLFGSSAVRRKNSELVVFIVPHIHSSETALNKNLLKNIDIGFNEEKKTLRSQPHDVIPKLQMSSKLWGEGQQLGQQPLGELPPPPAPMEASESIFSNYRDV